MKDQYVIIRENLGLGPGPTTTISLVIPVDYRDRLKALAQAERRSMNAYGAIHIWPSIKAALDQQWKKAFGSKKPEDVLKK